MASGVTASPWRRLARQPLLYCLLALLFVHIGVVFGPLVYDDEHAVLQNTAIRDLGNIPAYFVDPDLFSSTAGRMYRPLVLTTLAIDHAIGGGAAWAFKLGNLLQHLLATALLFQLLLLVFRRAGVHRERRELAAALGAFLFALHPLQVESLALVSSRSEILAAIGLAIASIAWLRFPSRPVLRTTYLLLGTAVACLSKETGVLVPPFVFLLELLLPDAKERRGALLSRAPRLLLRLAPVLPVVLGYLLARKALFGVATASVRALSTGGDPYGGGTRDLATQLLSMTWFLPKALLLFVFPAGLSIDHTEFGVHAFGSLPFVLGAALVLAFPVSAILLRRRYPIYALACFGALLFALPWILIPLNVPLAEHRLYVPLLFAVWPVSLLLVRVLRLFRKKSVRVALSVILLGSLAVASAERQRIWRDPTVLWSDCLATNPKSFRALCGLADVEWSEGHLERALRYLERCQGVYDRYLPARRNLCEIRVRLMDKKADLGFALETVRIVERFAEERWKDPFARLLCARARRALYGIRKDPSDLRAGVSWGLSCLAMVEAKMLVFRTTAEIYRLAQRYEDALALFDVSRGMGLSNRDFDTHEAEVLLAAGKLEEAERMLAKLLKSGPGSAVLLGVEARLLARRGRRKDFDRVLRELAILGYDARGIWLEEAKARATPR